MRCDTYKYHVSHFAPSAEPARLCAVLLHGRVSVAEAVGLVLLAAGVAPLVEADVAAALGAGVHAALHHVGVVLVALGAGALI